MIAEQSQDEEDKVDTRQCQTRGMRKIPPAAQGEPHRSTRLKKLKKIGRAKEVRLDEEEEEEEEGLGSAMKGVRSDAESSLSLMGKAEDSSTGEEDMMELGSAVKEMRLGDGSEEELDSAMIRMRLGERSEEEEVEVEVVVNKSRMIFRQTGKGKEMGQVQHAPTSLP